MRHTLQGLITAGTFVILGACSSRADLGTPDAATGSVADAASFVADARSSAADSSTPPPDQVGPGICVGVTDSCTATRPCCPGTTCLPGLRGPTCQ